MWLGLHQSTLSCFPGLNHGCIRPHSAWPAPATVNDSLLPEPTFLPTSCFCPPSFLCQQHSPPRHQLSNALSSLAASSTSPPLRSPPEPRAGWVGGSPLGPHPSLVTALPLLLPSPLGHQLGALPSAPHTPRAGLREDFNHHEQYETRLPWGLALAHPFIVILTTLTPHPPLPHSSPNDLFAVPPTSQVRSPHRLSAFAITSWLHPTNPFSPFRSKLLWGAFPVEGTATAYPLTLFTSILAVSLPQSYFKGQTAWI